MNIFLGKEEAKMKEFLIGSDPAEALWHDLVSKESKTIRSAYIIESLPSFVLIDTEGRIFKAPAEPPSGNIAKTFSNILLEKEDNPTIIDPGGH